MKKLLGAVLAAALLFPPGPASAELLKNLKVGGQLDIQANSARNISNFSTNADNAGTRCTGGVKCNNNDRIGNALTRVLLNVSWDLLDDVHSMVTLRKNDRAWATTGVVGQQGAGGNQGLIGAPGAADVASNLTVQQAYVKIDKLGGWVDTTLGRQYYGDAGDLIIYFGPKDNYGLFATSIDAARFEASNDWLNFSGIAGKTAQAGSLATGVVGGVAANANNAATNVRGFDVGWKNLPVKINTFVWNRVIQGAGALGLAPSRTTAVTGLNDNLWVYGAKLHGEAMGGWATATLAANAGEDRTTLAGVAAPSATTANYIGKALMVDAGWHADVTNIGGFTPWGNFGWGTGRSSNLEAHNEGFTSIASDYRPGIINRLFDPTSALNLGSALTAGAIGTNGLNNRVVWGIGLKFKPAAVEKLTTGVSYWDYRLQRNTFTGVGTTAAAKGNKHLGSEVDLTADWKHSENVMVSAGIGSFQPGGFVKESIAGDAPAAPHGNSPATLAFADFTVKF